jgi:hypothetical protein
MARNSNISRFPNHWGIATNILAYTILWSYCIVMCTAMSKNIKQAYKCQNHCLASYLFVLTRDQWICLNNSISLHDSKHPQAIWHVRCRYGIYRDISIIQELYETYILINMKLHSNPFPFIFALRTFIFFKSIWDFVN